MANPFDDMSAPPLTPKEVAANEAAFKLQEAAKNPKAIKAEKRAQSSSITVVPGMKKGGMVRGHGCESSGKTQGKFR